MQQATTDANAFAASLDNVAVSSDRTDTVIRRSTPGVDALTNKLDLVTRTTNSAERAAVSHAAAVDVLTAAVQKGIVPQDTATRSLEASATKVAFTSLQVATLNDALAKGIAPTADMITKAALLGKGAEEAGSKINSGMTQELIRLGHEALTGNFSRIPGSIIVLGERAGNLGSIFQSVAGFMTGWGGIAVGVIAGLTAMGVASELSARQLEVLGNQIAFSKANYAALAIQANEAAKAVSAAGGGAGISAADARTVAGSVIALPEFSGSTQQLSSLISLAGQLADMLGVKVPEAAKTYVEEVITNPGKAVDTLVSQHLLGLNAVLADQIKMQAQAGDTAGASARLLDLETAAAKAQHDNLTDLGKAWDNLGASLSTAGQHGRSFFNDLGSFVTGTLAAAINSVAALVKGINALYNFVVPTQSGALPGASAGSTPGMIVVPPNTKLNPTVAQQIYDIAQQLQQKNGTSQELAGLQADYATAYIMEESGGQQFINGHVNTSQTGAMGLGQLMPATASTLGVDATDQTQNITGTLTLIAKYWQKYNGDPELVTLAMAMGPGALDAILAGTKSVQSITPEAQGAFTKITGKAIGDINWPAATQGLGTQNAYGLVNDPNAQIAEALKANASTLPAQIVANQQQQSAVQLALQQPDLSTDQIAQLSAQLDTLKGKETELVTTQQALKQSAVDSVAGLSAQAGYERQMADIHDQFAVAARKAGTAIDQQALSIAQLVAIEKDQTAFQDTINAQDRTTAGELRVAAAYDGTTYSVTHAQNAEKARSQAMSDNLDMTQQTTTDYINKYTASLDAGTAATERLAQEQASISALAGAFSSAFDTIGNAISQAFVQGQGAAVNWRNVMDSVISQVIQQFLKLAIINPILNSAFGQNLGTLGTAVGVLTGANAAAGSSIDGTSTGSSFLSSIGLGPLLSGGSLLANIGLSGSGGIGGLFGSSGAIGSILSTNIFGAGAATDATTAALTALGPGVFGPATAGSVGLSGLTLGGLLGPVGLGAGAGSLLNSVLGGNQLGGTIGSGVGSIGGALIGSVVPVVGTLIGGIIGGLVGGAGGGLFGPPKENSYSSTGISINNGQLSVGKTVAQLVDPTAQIADTQSEAQALDQFLQANGISLTSLGAATQIGQNTPGGFQDPSKFASVASAFSGFQFNSNDPTIGAAINGQSFGSLTDLQNAVATAQANAQATTTTNNANVAAFQASVTALQKQFGDLDTAALGPLGTTLDNLTTQFNTAIASANTLGQSTDELTSIQQNAIAQAQAAADQPTVTSLLSFVNGLQYGTSSPLSPQAQYAQAQSQFQAVAGAAAAGDLNSINNLPTYANNFLTASKAVNGSGLQYAQDFSSVLAAVQPIVNLGQDGLTNAVLISETRTQTQQLQASLQQLSDQLNTLIAAVNAGSGAPARIAA
jgi:hypothetical protein